MIGHCHSWQMPERVVKAAEAFVARWNSVCGFQAGGAPAPSGPPAVGSQNRTIDRSLPGDGQPGE
jgi:hypothetical protein